MDASRSTASGSLDYVDTLRLVALLPDVLRQRLAHVVFEARAGYADQVALSLREFGMWDADDMSCDFTAHVLRALRARDLG